MSMQTVSGSAVDLWVLVWCSKVFRWGKKLEDDEKLKKLEERLVELKFVTTPKLEILCSHSFLPHLNEPMEMAMLPGPTGERQATRIVGLTRYWRPGGKHDRQRQRKRKARRERGGAKTR